MFALTILLPGGLLAALGVRALVQERRAAEVEIEKRLGRAADLAAETVEREIASWQGAAAFVGATAVFDAMLLPATLRAASGEPGSLVIVAFGPDGPQVWPSHELLYSVGRVLPVSAAVTSLPLGLAAAEAAELRDRNYPAAIQLYEALLKTAAAADRPLLVHRLGRTYRQVGRHDEAMARFRELQGVAQLIGALSADFIGTYEICSVWSAPADAGRLASCARDFYRSLVNGRWRLEKSPFLYYAATAREWLERAAPSDPALAELAALERKKTALTDLVAGLAGAADVRADTASSVTPMNVATTPGHLVITWADRASGGWRRAIVLATGQLQTQAWASLLAAAIGDDLHVEVAAGGSGVLFQSQVPPDAPAGFGAPIVSRTLADARLPLRVRVWPRDPAALSAEISQTPDVLPVRARPCRARDGDRSVFHRARRSARARRRSAQV